MTRGAGVAAGVVLALVLGFQFKAMSDLRKEVQSLRAELNVASEPENPLPSTTTSRSVSLGTLPQRVGTLEQSVADLSRISDLLMERGLVPPSAERRELMQAKFFDLTASDRDRIRAFQMMRRNGGITDDIALQAASWLQTATNAATRRGLLRELDGLTNSVLKAPLLAMLGNETNGGVKEQLVDALADFVNDPSVEQKMWDLALNDPDGDVREEAGEALTDGPMTPERISALKDRAADSQLPLEARLMALRGLGEADQEAPEVVAEMAQLAQNTTDPLVRAKLFEAFDDIRDSNLVLPLVNGLQDPNPIVRERAVDALAGFGSDERIKQWLSHVAQNDADPRVKREAFRALQQGEERGRRGRN